MEQRRENIIRNFNFSFFVFFVLFCFFFFFFYCKLTVFQFKYLFPSFSFLIDGLCVTRIRDRILIFDEGEGN